MSYSVEYMIGCYCDTVLWFISGEEAEVEEEEEEEEEQKGPDLKQASRRDMYSICQAAGLGV